MGCTVGGILILTLLVVKTHPTVRLIFVLSAVHKILLNKIIIVKNYFWFESKIPCLSSHTVELQRFVDLAGLSHFTGLEPLGSSEKALLYHPLILHFPS